MEKVFLSKLATPHTGLINVSGSWALASLGVAAAALGLSRWFWQYALRSYTSASS